MLFFAEKNQDSQVPGESKAVLQWVGGLLVVFLKLCYLLITWITSTNIHYRDVSPLHGFILLHPYTAGLTIIQHTEGPSKIMCSFIYVSPIFEWPTASPPETQQV